MSRSLNGYSIYVLVPLDEYESDWKFEGYYPTKIETKERLAQTNYHPQDIRIVRQYEVHF